MPLKWLARPWLLLSQFSVCHEVSHPAPPQCALRCTVHKQQPRDSRLKALKLRGRRNPPSVFCGFFFFWAFCHNDKKQLRHRGKGTPALRWLWSPESWRCLRSSVVSPPGMVGTSLFPKQELLGSPFYLLPSNGYSQWGLTEFCPAQIQIDTWPSILFCRFLKVSLNSNIFPRSLPHEMSPSWLVGRLLLSGLSFSCYLGRHWGRWQNTELSFWLLLPQASQSRTICARCGKPRCFNSLSVSLSLCGRGIKSEVHSVERSLLHNPFDPGAA